MPKDACARHAANAASAQDASRSRCAYDTRASRKGTRHMLFMSALPTGMICHAACREAGGAARASHTKRVTMMPPARDTRCRRKMFCLQRRSGSATRRDLLVSSRHERVVGVEALRRSAARVGKRRELLWVLRLRRREETRRPARVYALDAVLSYCRAVRWRRRAARRVPETITDMPRHAATELPAPRYGCCACSANARCRYARAVMPPDPAASMIIRATPRYCRRHTRGDARATKSDNARRHAFTSKPRVMFICCASSICV